MIFACLWFLHLRTEFESYLNNAGLGTLPIFCISVFLSPVLTLITPARITKGLDGSYSVEGCTLIFNFPVFLRILRKGKQLNFHVSY